MSGGRTFWFAQDVARHRRALMVELQEDHGPVALAVDVVLQSHAKEQNDGGRIRDGFAAVAAEAGCSRDEARAFIADAADIGWIDDLEVDRDGRRFTCRLSGWKADQDRVNAAWRKAKQRAKDREPVFERDCGDPEDRVDGTPNPPRPSKKSRSVTAVTECPPTAQHSTAQHVVDSPNPSGRARDPIGLAVLPGGGTAITDHIAGILARGVDSLTSDEPARPPTADAVGATLGAVDGWSWDMAVSAAVAAREIAQAQNRAPNIVGLFEAELRKRMEAA